MEATQPTFNEVFDMACMLSRQERKAHIAESERQFAAGNVYSEEESDAMMDQIVEDTILIVDFYDTRKSVAIAQN